MSDSEKGGLAVKIRYLSSGEEPFVFWACGALTLDALAEIEKDAHENMDEMFRLGDGDYTFEMVYIRDNAEDTAYWEPRLLFWTPQNERAER